MIVSYFPGCDFFKCFLHFLNFLKEFSGLHYCLFVKVLSLLCFTRNSFILSCVFPFVNNFFENFNFSIHHLLTVELNSTISHFACQLQDIVMNYRKEYNYLSRPVKLLIKYHSAPFKHGFSYAFKWHNFFLSIFLSMISHKYKPNSNRCIRFRCYSNRVC